MTTLLLDHEIMNTSASSTLMILSPTASGHLSHIPVTWHHAAWNAIQLHYCQRKQAYFSEADLVGNAVESVVKEHFVVLMTWHSCTEANDNVATRYTAGTMFFSSAREILIS